MQLQQPYSVGQATSVSLAASILAEDEPVKDQPVQVIVTPARPSFNQVFIRYQAMAQKIEELARAQQAFEVEHFGRQITDTPSLQGIRRIAERALTALTGRAQSEFAPSGTVLEISESETLERTGQDDWRRQYEIHWDKFRHANRRGSIGGEAPMILDLDKVWADLERTYGGDAGLETGYKQQAAVIVNFFNLKNNDSVSRTKSCAVLTARMWAKKKDYGPEKGKYETESRERVSNLIKALCCFAERAGLRIALLCKHLVQ